MRCKCPWTHHRRFPSPSPSPYPDPPSPSPLSQLSVLPNCALLRFDSMCAKQDHYFLLNHTISYFFLLDCVKMKCTLSGSRRHGDFLACFLFVSALPRHAVRPAAYLEDYAALLVASAPSSSFWPLVLDAVKSLTIDNFSGLPPMVTRTRQLPRRSPAQRGCSVLSRGADILCAAFLPLAGARDASSHNRSDSRNNL